MFFGAGIFAARLCSSAIASSYLPWRSRSSAEANSEGGEEVEEGESGFASCASCPTQLIATRRKASRGLGTDIKNSPGRYARSEERRVGKECRSRWSPYH